MADSTTNIIMHMRRVKMPKINLFLNTSLSGAVIYSLQISFGPFLQKVLALVHFISVSYYRHLINGLDSALANLKSLELQQN